MYSLCLIDLLVLSGDFEKYIIRSNICPCYNLFHPKFKCVFDYFNQLTLTSRWTSLCLCNIIMRMTVKQQNTVWYFGLFQQFQKEENTSIQIKYNFPSFLTFLLSSSEILQENGKVVFFIYQISYPTSSIFCLLFCNLCIFLVLIFDINKFEN